MPSVNDPLLQRVVGLVPVNLMSKVHHKIINIAKHVEKEIRKNRTQTLT